MSKRDPILEEIHATRAEILREADYDLNKVLEAARARQGTSGMKVSNLPLRKKLPVKNVS